MFVDGVFFYLLSTAKVIFYININGQQMELHGVVDKDKSHQVTVTHTTHKPTVHYVQYVPWPNQDPVNLYLV